MKYTRGPWRIGNGTCVVADTPTRNWGKSFSINYYSREDERRHYGGDLIAESINVEANARLIAASPDLLEACKAVLAVGGEDWEAGERVLRAAIAKAERRGK